jgi:hypothetical protein
MNPPNPPAPVATGVAVARPGQGPDLNTPEPPEERDLMSADRER